MRYVTLLFTLVPFMMVGCHHDREVALEISTGTEAPLRLGVPQAEDRESLRREFAPLMEAIARGAGRPVELVDAPTYRSVGWLLEQGEIDLAWFSGVAFEEVSRLHPATALVRASRRDLTTYVGELVVPAGSPVLRVRDLKGRRLAYVDPESGSGFVAANQMLLDAGISPGADLARTGFTYSHRESLRAVLSGRFDAAAVFEGALELYTTDIPPGSFRVLARSDPLPNDVVACSPGFDPVLRGRIARALLEMSRTASGRSELARTMTYGGLDGFVEP